MTHQRELAADRTAAAAIGSHTAAPASAPATAVPADPAAIFRAPTQMNTCPLTRDTLVPWGL